MTEDELRDFIQSWENIPLLIRHIFENPEKLNLVLKIAMDNNQAKSWRAMWLLDKIHEQNPQLILPYFPALNEFLLYTNDSSKKRHVLKLISLHEIPEDKIVHLLNHCIDVFTNHAEPIAVRVHAMQILFNIALKAPDFANELVELIEHEIEFYGSAGIASRGRKLLAKLYRMK